jgi:hypothetical protein
MLLRPLDAPSSDPPPSATRRPAVVRLGGLELSSFVDPVPMAGSIVVDLPTWPGDDRRGLTGERIEVRWRVGDGVVTAVGTTEPGPARGRITVVLDAVSAPSDERLARRVPVKVATRLVVFGDHVPVAVETRTRNVSIGGVALDPVGGIDLEVGQRGIVAVDPRGVGVLAGVAVVAPGAGDVPLRLRFDEMSGTQQDRLVGLINREELRCTLR